MPIIDLGIKNYQQNERFGFIENKIWVYRWLKKYQEGIDFINSFTENISFQNPFGKNYYLQTFEILKFNAQNDTVKRNHCIRELIEYMNFTFTVYDNLHNGSPLSDSTWQRIQARNLNIPSVDPNEYSALLSYYTVRLLLDKKEVLLKEVEKITLSHDFEDGQLKADLIDLIKYGDPERFYN